MGYDPIDTDETDSNADKDITVDAINGADTSAAAAGEALTSNGSGSLAFASVGDIEEVTTIGDLPDDNKPQFAFVTDENQYFKFFPLIGSPFDITSSALSQTFNYGTSGTNPSGIAWDNSGDYFYTCGFDNIYQTKVSTSFDISTASGGYNDFAKLRDTDHGGVAFNDDGSKFYVTHQNANVIDQYSLSTNFDIGTESLDTTLNHFGDSTLGIAFNDTGTKLYECDEPNSEIIEVSLSTPYDIDTATLSQTKTVNSPPSDLAYNSDGSRLIIISRQNDVIEQYDLSTPFDINTAVFDTSIAGPSGSNDSIAFDNVGSKMYVLSDAGESLKQFVVTEGGWEAF